jgi:hypothetical protein
MRSLVVLLLLVFLAYPVRAQDAPFGGSWRFPMASELVPALLSGGGRPDPSVCTFTPKPGNSAAEDLSIALSGTPDAQASLLKTMMDLRGIYDEAVAKEGHANNLAAGLSYFLACDLTVFTGHEPSQAASQKMFEQLEAAIAATPAVAGLEDAEKQEMHDWLVAMGGVTLATYVGASVSKDPESMANARRAGSGPVASRIERARSHHLP